MASEQKPDVDQSAKQIRASVLHGAGDLRIVNTQLISYFLLSVLTQSRKTDPSSPPDHQNSKSAFAAQGFADRICIITVTTAMEISLCENPCRWGMNPPVW